jgi:hypothetical protein
MKMARHAFVYPLSLWVECTGQEKRALVHERTRAVLQNAENDHFIDRIQQSTSLPRTLLDKDGPI